MKRMPLRLLLFLLAGAIINVAVAWGCAYWNLPRSSTSKEISRAQAEAIVFPNGGLDDRQARLRQNQGFGFRLTMVAIETGTTTWHIAVERGWPVLSFLGRARSDVSGDYKTENAVHWTGAPIQGVRQLYVVPLKPIFPGFAINTIFYAAIAWMMFAVPGMIRRRVRRKRGQCAACGYSLRGRGTPQSEKCPECGAAV